MDQQVTTIGDMPKRPRRSSGGSKPKRVGKTIHVWVPAQLRDQVDELLKQTRRDLTTEVQIALEKHLANHRLWPPPEKPADDAP